MKLFFPKMIYFLSVMIYIQVNYYMAARNGFISNTTVIYSMK